MKWSDQNVPNRSLMKHSETDIDPVKERNQGFPLSFFLLGFVIKMTVE